jgi:hypothetical protein
MTEEPRQITSHPDEDSGGADASARRRGRRRVPIPSVDQLLEQLIQLNGAVAIGAMSTKDANLIHKNLRAVLDVQMKRASREETGPSQEALLELCRSDPRVLNVIAPFLSDAHMDWVMNEVTDDQDGSN